MKYKILSVIFLSAFLSCKTSPDYKHTISERMASRSIVPDAIQIRLIDFDDENVNISIFLSEKLPDTEYLPKEKSDIYIKKITDSEFNTFSVPSGLYYGRIRISATKIHPAIYTEFAEVRFQIGYKRKGMRFVETGALKCIIKRDAVLELNSYVCPKLKVSKEASLSLVIKKSKESSNWVHGTTMIWLYTVTASIMTVSPAGLIMPVILGPVGNSKSVELIESDKKETPVP